MGKLNRDVFYWSQITEDSGYIGHAVINHCCGKTLELFPKILPSPQLRCFLHSFLFLFLSSSSFIFSLTLCFPLLFSEVFSSINVLTLFFQGQGQIGDMCSLHLHEFESHGLSPQKMPFCSCLQILHETLVDTHNTC